MSSIKRIFVVAAGVSLGSLGVAVVPAGAQPVNTLYVSKTSAGDVGTCSTPATACQTVDYALTQAVAGDTIKVAAGTYNQTVAITIPVRLEGAGASHTTLDGSGIDSSGTTYGVVYVGTTGGAVSVSGFTITNPFPDSYTGGEPEIVALADTNPSDSVVITKNVLSEGAVDTNAGTDFPIGLDTFKNAASTTITHNTMSGTFQGALLEDNGPVTFANNTIKNLITGTDDSTSPPTVYPPDGLFFLSDLSGSLTGQNAAHNKFSNFAGFGIAMDAGYSNGNCSVPNPCNGSISGTLTRNHFALGASSGTAAIDLESQFAGNNLTATVNNNTGFVTSPSQAIDVVADGGTTNVTQNGNRIAVHH
jgi:hypothetical protein